MPRFRATRPARREKSCELLGQSGNFRHVQGGVREGAVFLVDRALGRASISLLLRPRFGSSLDRDSCSSGRSVRQAATNQGGDASSFQGCATSRRERSFLTLTNLASATGPVTAKPVLRA